MATSIWSRTNMPCMRQRAMLWAERPLATLSEWFCVCVFWPCARHNRSYYVINYCVKPTWSYCEFRNSKHPYGAVIFYNRFRSFLISRPWFQDTKPGDQKLAAMWSLYNMLLCRPEWFKTRFQHKIVRSCLSKIAKLSNCTWNSYCVFSTQESTIGVRPPPEQHLIY